MAVIFDDSFGGGGGYNTPLASHTPDTTGTSWTEEVNSSTNQAIVADEPGTEGDMGTNLQSDETAHGIYSITPDPATTEYDIELTGINFQSGGATTRIAILVARFTDTDNFYTYEQSKNSGDDGELWKRVAGTDTQITSADPADSNGDILTEWRTTSPRIRVAVSTTELFTSDDTAHTGAAAIGLGTGDLTQSGFQFTSFSTIQNYVVTEQAGAASNPKGPLGMPLHGAFGGPI